MYTVHMQVSSSRLHVHTLWQCPIKSLASSLGHILPVFQCYTCFRCVTLKKWEWSEDEDIKSLGQYTIIMLVVSSWFKISSQLGCFVLCSLRVSLSKPHINGTALCEVHCIFIFIVY